MLWAEGMSKEERGIIVSQLRKLTIALPFEERAVADEDREEIGEKLSGVKASLEAMVAYLMSKGYLKASGYLHRAGEKLFTYVEQWLGRGIQMGKTTGIIERTMREIARRAKRIGASWKEVLACSLSSSSSSSVTSTRKVTRDSGIATITLGHVRRL